MIETRIHWTNADEAPEGTIYVQRAPEGDEAWVKKDGTWVSCEPPPREVMG